MKPIDRLWPGGRALEPAVLEGDLEQDPGSDPGAARYVVNPKLAVIESYALDVIGELSPEEVEEAENAVVGLFGEAPDWRCKVRKQLGWNPLVDALIQQVQTGRVMLGARAGQGELSAAPSADLRVETPFLQMVLTRLWDEEMRTGSRMKNP